MNSTFSRALIGGTLSLLIVFGLNACKGPQETLPEGPQTMSGVLQPVPISITRRGSHVLQQHGESTYYVESASEDLRNFEGVDVVVTGLLEWNTDPDALPVLVASGVRLVDMPVRSWTVDALKLMLDTPVDWSITQFDDGARFTQTGSTATLFTVLPSSLARLPAGAILQVSGRRAARVNASGALTVYVQNGGSIIALSYTPPAGESPVAADRTFNRVIRSMQFIGAPSSQPSSASTSAQSGTGAAAGMPCGGPAGVLCPAGEYCAITDPVDGIGRCRSLKR